MCGTVVAMSFQIVFRVHACVERQVLPQDVGCCAVKDLEMEENLL